MSIIILLCNSSCSILYWRMKWQIVHDIHKKMKKIPIARVMTPKLMKIEKKNQFIQKKKYNY